MPAAGGGGSPAARWRHALARACWYGSGTKLGHSLGPQWAFMLLLSGEWDHSDILHVTGSMWMLSTSTWRGIKMGCLWLCLESGREIKLVLNCTFSFICAQFTRSFANRVKMLKWADDNTCPFRPFWGPRWLYVLCLLSVGSVGPRAHTARTPRTAARAALGSRLGSCCGAQLGQRTPAGNISAVLFTWCDISYYAKIFAWNEWYLRDTGEICNLHDTGFTGNKKHSCCDGDRARRWEHRGKYSQEVWRKSLSHLTIRSCVATAIVFWIFTLGFEFAGSVALSSDGRFRVAIILINFQLIINCCFNEAFPFVIIYKINFDIWKLNFLSNFGTIHLAHWLARGLKISLNRGSRTHYLVDTEAVAASSISPLTLLD